MTVKIDVSKCDGCETCIEVCPVEAITIVDEHAVVDADECIDCLVCIDECPNEAISEEE